jgi:hypothetical protein
VIPNAKERKAINRSNRTELRPGAIRGAIANSGYGYRGQQKRLYSAREDAGMRTRVGSGMSRRM